MAYTFFTFFLKNLWMARIVSRSRLANSGVEERKKEKK